jgi:hypothetical protein
MGMDILMKKFLVTYDILMDSREPHWYVCHYSFVEAEDQDAAIDKFLTDFPVSDYFKLSKMMIADLTHVYKVPL